MQVMERPAVQTLPGVRGAKPAIEVEGLVKRFPAPGGGTLTAVDDISFTVRYGEVFGFLGPNGAGKTTTLEIIEGLQEPTAGRTNVLGFDSVRDRVQMKQRIGVQIQSGAYFDFLTLEEILDLFGSFYPKSLPPRQLLELVGLEGKSKAQVRELSGGQAQRFSIVAALVNDPEVVFLDEPTTGLDPQARHNLWEFIATLKTRGKTVVLTTHYMEEAALLCDRVAIIDSGRIRALDTVPGLVRQLPAPYRITFLTHDAIDVEALQRLPETMAAERSSDSSTRYELQVRTPQIGLQGLMEWIARRGVHLDEIQVVPATLEDAFLSLTGRSLRE